MAKSILKCAVVGMGIVTLSILLAGQTVQADTLTVTAEFQATTSTGSELRPSLGDDSLPNRVMVYSSSPTNGANHSVWYQRISLNARVGAPELVSLQNNGVQVTDDNFNDVSGDLIVYTAFTGPSADIRIFNIDTETTLSLEQGSVSGAKIHGNNVVWRSHVGVLTNVVLADASGIGSPVIISDQTGSASELDIGDTFVVWHQEGDVLAYDLVDSSATIVASSARTPSTSGSWVVWESGANIFALDMDDPMRTTVQITSDSLNLNPSIDGGIIAWESFASGNFDIQLHRLADSSTYQLTSNPSDQQLNSIFGNQVAYLDDRNFMGFGTHDIFVSTFSINQPPVANAGPDVDLILGVGFAQLLGSGSDPDGDPIVSYQWSIDLAPALSRALLSDTRTSDPFLIPDIVGNYEISLIVNDGMDDSAQDTMVIRVAQNLPPTAVASSDVSTGAAPLTVNFDSSQSSDPEGVPLTLQWEFGDASLPSTEISPTHVYLAPGTFLVTLTVSDGLSTAQNTLLVTVLPPQNIPPTASPTAIPNSGTAPLSVQFTANASDGNGDALTYFWDFGDPTSANNTSTDADPDHTYAAAGTYTAFLTVSDGQDDFTTSLVIVVDTPPVQVIDILKVIEDGDIRPSGNGMSGAGRLGAFINMLNTADDLIADGQIAEACQQLLDAYRKTDGLSGKGEPPDFISGPDALAVAGLIQDLRSDLGCM